MARLRDALDEYLRGGFDVDFAEHLVKRQLLGVESAQRLRQQMVSVEESAFAKTDLSVTEVDPAFVQQALNDSSFGIGVTLRSARVVSKADEERPRHDRYELRRLLGVGGMGEVYEMADRNLNRPVALKRVRLDRQDPASVARFLVEAQVTAQLEHPHIVPVHESGQTPDGNPYFTMKRVEGTNLRSILTSLRLGESEASERYPLARLMISFLNVVEAVAYAHARGVIHGDLKPENVLLGRHGEVLVADWGMAQLLPEAADPRELPVSLAPGTPRVEIRGGTPVYMSPEQLQGEAIDARSDIYSLGAILYEILTLEAVYAPASSSQDIVQLYAQPIVPPRMRAPRREIPPELESICLKSLARAPENRFAHAEEVRASIEAFLTGARKRETARERFQEGEAAHASLVKLKEERTRLWSMRQNLAAGVKPYDPEIRKRPLWTVEEKLALLDVQIEHALAEAIDGWSQAVGIDSGFSEPATRLADIHLELFLEAERAGDRRQMHYHRRLVERHHRGRHSAILSGEGSLTVLPEQGEARFSVDRLDERGKRIVAVERILMDAASTESLRLPMGSYLLSLQASGCVPAYLPVWVGRGSNTVLRPRLREAQEVPKGFVHVPAGPFLYGGDKEAPNSGPREERWLDDFLIARFPVTCAEYCEFLNHLNETMPHLVSQHVPRTRPDGGHLWVPNDQGRFFVPRFDADGNPGHPDAPVMGVSFTDAQAYASWRSSIDGRRYRLPTEAEWEKAARGADGRIFPWGNGFDPTFCKMALSRPGRPQPEPVGSFPTDTSVFGMQDCAGAIREWCDDFYDDNRETRVLRGGAWYFNASFCRVCFRHGYMPHIVFTNFGIRLAVSL